MDDLQYLNKMYFELKLTYPVLNLVINGWPSIHVGKKCTETGVHLSFKPCYKWMTFNTSSSACLATIRLSSFKPCYKWMTFNTFIKKKFEGGASLETVLNLVINGWPSIQ